MALYRIKLHLEQHTHFIFLTNPNNNSGGIMNSRDLVRQWTNIIAVAATLVVNGLANAIPLNGQQTGEISDRFQVYFVPAGYVFAIWGLIYLGLIAFGIYQALPAQRANPRLRAIGYWFVASCVANIAWIFLWHYNYFVWTLFAMLGLLICLIIIYQRLGTGLRKSSPAETWCVQIPFSIYLGWISVATIANVTDVLYILKWNGFGLNPQLWAVVMLIIALIVGGLMAWRRADWAYLLVFVWAFAGIGVKQADFSLVANAAWTAAVISALLVFVAFWRTPKIYQTN
jgi:benzodiazapine receptor